MIFDHFGGQKSLFLDFLSLGSVWTIPRTTGSDPYFFRIRTQGYGYGKITGTGENSKEVTEYGTSSEVFENTKYGYGTMTEFF